MTANAAAKNAAEVKQKFFFSPQKPVRTAKEQPSILTEQASHTEK